MKDNVSCDELWLIVEGMRGMKGGPPYSSESEAEQCKPLYDKLRSISVNFYLSGGRDKEEETELELTLEEWEFICRGIGHLEMSAGFQGELDTVETCYKLCKRLKGKIGEEAPSPEIDQSKEEDDKVVMIDMTKEELELCIHSMREFLGACGQEQVTRKGLKAYIKLLKKLIKEWKEV